ncbi:DnaA N-terminal domain-containing protein [Gymnodinialimonas sp. 2305UL16-5]|uniref:DnaA N-terminal domain-containing protein n=1 Tax=Gymnodinialimonas mytili TaxID=3126503 RepID=UPI0030957B6D
MAQHETGIYALSRPTIGPGASAIKYDILTALLVTSTCGEATAARLALRLSLLITARFNWRSGSFSVGRKEMARMWGVTERTAKREMAQMKALGWIAVSVPAARGRVAQYKIDLPAVLRATMPHWAAVGPDFVARMTDTPEKRAETNVIPLRASLPVEDNGTGWAKVAARLREENPALFEAWFAGLQAVDLENGTLTLLAPSRFVATYLQAHFAMRLLAAVTAEIGRARDIQIIAEG